MFATECENPAERERIAIAKSKPATCDAIVVHKFDRFSRSREDHVVYKADYGNGLLGKVEYHKAFS